MFGEICVNAAVYLPLSTDVSNLVFVHGEEMFMLENCGVLSKIRIEWACNALLNYGFIFMISIQVDIYFSSPWTLPSFGLYLIVSCLSVC